MKLINTGLGRTGTTSLKAALEMLGIAPVFHAPDLFTNTKYLDVWEAACEGQTIDWRTFFADYEVADWPVAFFYKEIIKAYPEAKVMITVRDPEEWFKNFKAVWQQVLSINLPIPRLQRLRRFIRLRMMEEFFEGKGNDKAQMVCFFENYVEGVKEFVPADKLLVYNVTEGWEPLCEFLEVDVPQQAFPNANKGGGFKEFVTSLMTGAQQ